MPVPDRPPYPIRSHTHAARYAFWPVGGRTNDLRSLETYEAALPLSRLRSVLAAVLLLGASESHSRGADPENADEHFQSHGRTCRPVYLFDTALGLQLNRSQC